MPSKNRIDEAASLIRERMQELDTERARLERALADLTGKEAEGRKRTARSTPSRSRAAKRGGRRRRGGTRADQAVKLVEENPGIQASEIAKQMGIQPNYLYRVLAELAQEGRIRKDGRRYNPVGK